MKFFFFQLLIFLNIVAQNWSIEGIMSKPDFWGERVKSFEFSNDEKSVIYKYKSTHYQHNLSNGELTKLDPFFENLNFNKIDQKRYLYKDNQSYYLLENNLQNRRLLYQSNENEHVYFAKNFSKKVIVNKKQVNIFEPDKNKIYYFKNKKNFRSRALSKDGKNLILSSYETPKTRDLYFPDYLAEQTKPGAKKYSVYKNSVHVLNIASLSLDKIFEQKEGGYISRISVSNNSRYLAFVNRPIDRKKIEFYVYDLKNKKLSLVYRAASKKWLVGAYLRMEFSPSSAELLFIALSGNHEKLFVYNLQRKKNKLITAHEAEITYATWLNNEEILYISNENTPLERDIYKFSKKYNASQIIIKSNGFIRSPKLSPNKKYLAYQFSKLATPDELYVLDIEAAKHIRLSNTIPNGFKKSPIIKPELLKIKSLDKRFDIYANFYHKDDKKKPLIVFVHGAGILQNVMNGWTRAYHREFLFHQFLMQNNYNVLDVDYRGSKGYSHSFSVDVHSHLGKKELQDIKAFIEHLKAKKLIDANKIGIYGGSYGGFMAAYALAFEPNLFKAGAALRSVFTWKHYYYTNEWYTRARLDRLEDHESWYIRSSPLYHVDKIKSPLLILHGMKDSNVPFQDAVKMVQEMLNKQKSFDLMIYPNEKHSFKSPKAWTDEYKRIFNYFEKYVK